MPVYRVMSRGENNQLAATDYGLDDLVRRFEQTGVEEDSYTMRLHGEPTFKGLIGPLSEGKGIVRYETPEVYTLLTLEWSKTRGNGKKHPAEAQFPAEEDD